MSIIRIGSTTLLNKIYLTSLKLRLNKIPSVVLNSLILVSRKTPSKRRFITLQSKKRGEELLKAKIEDLYISFLIHSYQLKFHHLQGSLSISKGMGMMNQLSLRKKRKQILRNLLRRKLQATWILRKIKIQLSIEICLLKSSIVISLAQWPSLPLQLLMILSTNQLLHVTILKLWYIINLVK